ncbi:hypothetical protein GCM10008023_05810 [Sphingomonas glacialis]|uniref:Uncharacterized protein n=1 Tax=Sphingomonas glacialis TaxID=658225 RepID=A0ABQ3L982_9SPHN|nr:hypothetical protein [Sphingomonas glacialis]GHH09304.1 hypothetical protein GCM10008023_05810 [Sphingomonas glacialis]
MTTPLTDAEFAELDSYGDIHGRMLTPARALELWEREILFGRETPGPQDSGLLKFLVGPFTGGATTTMIGDAKPWGGEYAPDALAEIKAYMQTAWDNLCRQKPGLPSAATVPTIFTLPPATKRAVRRSRGRSRGAL